MKEFLITVIAPEKGRLNAADEAACMMDYGRWAGNLGEDHVLGSRLAKEEGIILPKKDSIITDGPFIESKELIVGIVLIRANNLQKASEIASTCPLNAYFHLHVKEAMDR